MDILNPDTTIMASDLESFALEYLAPLNRYKKVEFTV